MSNGRIDIEVQGVNHSLHFGMSALKIWTEKAVSELQRVPNVKSDMQAFAYTVYAGLCNYADIKELPHPSFEEAYELAEEILITGDDLQNKVWSTFRESRAGKPLLDKLNPEKKSDPEAESQPLQTGTPSNPTPTES